MIRSIIAAVLTVALVNPAFADPGACSADWQCPHGTTCQAGHCAAPPAGPVAPSTGGGSAPSTGGGSAPSTGGSAPSTGGGSAPSTGGGSAPSTGGGSAPSTGGGSAPSTGGGSAPSTGGGSAPSTGGGSAPSTGGGSAPSTGGGSAPSTGGGSAPSTGGGSAPSTGGGSAPSTGTSVPAAGGGTPYGGGAPGPGGPYGAPGEPFSIQLVVSGGTNDIADNAHALYKPGSRLKLSVIARDAQGNVVAGCEPEFELDDNTIAGDKPHGALSGASAVFLRPGKFSIFAHCKNNPKITTRGAHNNFNFETATGRFAGCTDEPACACLDNCDIDQIEKDARDAVADNGAAKPAAKATNPALTVLGIGALALLVVYGYMVLSNAGGGGSSNYCFQITSSDNGSCPPDNYCAPSESDCETYLAQTMAICQCHVAQCTVNFSGCSAQRQAGHDFRDVNSLVTSGSVNQSRSTARLAPQGSSSHTNTRAIVLGAAVGTAALATTTYLIWRHIRPKDSRVEILPWVGPDGAGVMAAGRF